MTLPTLSGGAYADAQLVVDSRTGVFAHWNHAEQNSCEKRGAEREQNYRGVDGNLVQPRQIRWSYRNQHSNRAIGETQAEDAAEQSERDAFYQQGSSDIEPTRAQRRANSEFVLSSFGANQQKIRDVGAGDQ